VNNYFQLALDGRRKKQAEIYQVSADAADAIKVIFYFTESQLSRVER
jgi:hypothetical protein